MLGQRCSRNLPLFRVRSSNFSSNAPDVPSFIRNCCHLLLQRVTPTCELSSDDSSLLGMGYSLLDQRGLTPMCTLGKLYCSKVLMLRPAILTCRFWAHTYFSSADNRDK